MTKKLKSREALSMAETQRLLRSKPPVSVGKLSLDPLGVSVMAAIVRERLVSRGGRPSDPAWVISKKVPMRVDTWDRLDRCARTLQQMNIRVSAGQIAAIALERGLPRVEGEKVSVESIVMAHDVEVEYRFGVAARQKARKWIGPISRHSLFS